MKNECIDATFVIDSSKFFTPPAISKVHNLGGIGSTTLDYNYSTVISSSVTLVTDPCGDLQQEMFDITSGSEDALDPSIFNFDVTSNISYGSLIITASDLALAGVYNLRLRVKYEDYEDSGSDKDFNVELIDPCIDSTLNLILMPSNPLSQQDYYVGAL